MNIVLQIYSKNALQEFVLPPVNNTEFNINLESHSFLLSRDVLLRLEIVDGRWHFLEGTEKLKSRDDEYHGDPLCDGDILILELGVSESITIFVEERESSFFVYEKYAFAEDMNLTIGAGEENAIRYDYQGIVSRKHAMISACGTTAEIEDISSNGVFINHMRIQGKAQLSFGDRIDIFGLNLLYLGHFLAIRMTKGVFLDESALKTCCVEPDAPSEKTEHAGKVLYHRAPRQREALMEDTVEIEGPPNPGKEQETSLFMAIGPAMTMAIPMMLGSGMSMLASRMTGMASGVFMYTGIVTAVASAGVGVFWAVLNLHQARKKNRRDEMKRLNAYSAYLKKKEKCIEEKYQHNVRALWGNYPEASAALQQGMGSTALWNRNRNHKDFLTQRLGVGNIPFQVTIAVPKERFVLDEDALSDNPQMIQERYRMLKGVPVCLDIKKQAMIGVVGGFHEFGSVQIIYNLIAQITLYNCYTDVKLVFLYNEDQGKASGFFEFCKWFPHVWSEDRKVRFMAANKAEASEVLYELVRIWRIRFEEGNSDKKKDFWPHYVVVVADPSLLEDEPAGKYLLENPGALGITTVLMAQRQADLPNSCEYIIENDEEFSGMYGIDADTTGRIPIHFDKVDRDSLESFAREISNLQVNETENGGDVPNSLSFFDMYGITALEELEVLERWKKNRTYQSMKVLVGQKAGGVPCYLDVHEKYHGPHGLIAGTTGSGKSETLQTYILSLAINFSPDDLGFFLIDYKGGGMGNLFTNLPHMLGQISNLSGNQVRRAMVSIKSENRRRQRIFNDHGVNNINLYTTMYKNGEATEPIPHLFIIIDEFAELKREEPDFMKELISVAQVGRSLGVHLILSTQKPAGTVDDNIWSNSKFRLCLRVQDRQDSMDMLHRADAAYLTQAGRAYLQVGNDELFELFQSGWSGAAYDEDGSGRQVMAVMMEHTGKASIVGSHAKLLKREEQRQQWIGLFLECAEAANGDLDKIFKLLWKHEIPYEKNEYNQQRLQDLLAARTLAEDCGGDAAAVIACARQGRLRLPEMKEKTQLDAVIDYLAVLSKENGYAQGRRLWLPVLGEKIYWREFGVPAFSGETWPSYGKKWELEVPVGVLDDPAHQIQMPLILNFTQGGHHAVCGSVTSGKSTFLQTVAYALIEKYAPDYVNLYAIDFSSHMLAPFEGSPHFGGIMYENDMEKIDKFFYMISEILQERKKAFGGGNYEQYSMIHGQEYPAIVILIDNFANFKEKTAERYNDILIQLSREGVSYGVYMVIAAAGFSMAEIQGRIGDNIRTAICLEMSDKQGYSDVLRTFRIETLPEANIKGRGLALVDNVPLEFQTVLSLEAEDDYQRTEKLRERVAQMKQKWNGRLARFIPVIPEKPIWSEFEKLDAYRENCKTGRWLPIGYDRRTASVYSVDLSEQFCYLISGKTRTGKTNCMKAMMKAAAAIDGQVVVIDTPAEELRQFSAELGARYILDKQGQYRFFEELIPLIRERTAIKKAAMKEGCDDEEIFERMRDQKKIFVFISDIPFFVQELYRASDKYEMYGFLENITDKGALHNLFFFGCMSTEQQMQVIGRGVYDNFVRAKKGIHFGGALDSQKVFGFEDVSYSERERVYKAGIGYVPASGELGSQKVVIPLVKSES